ncbi:NUDIX hydrolase [Celeribacter indicus]|uniref:7,8-dihydro-8-oxoguanine triphosphatase n=1 Tax=Celeribacter indicus TaxID=1208324 RepID=A0A0B5DPY1_9RHOB|nr:NUDIX hydrolase [Celeribacter indicus]AJE45174.1 7,8-dihydro-8-oxoguanine triphosphatase [Celeribacter indicus]SDX25798.1 8-oxo-dGTP diphosphatase [Celeribacter indicus]
MSEPHPPFDGAKIAILRGEEVLVLLRDDRPDIPYPNHWDLPGGGREGLETPFQTAARELGEELSLAISPERVIYHREEAGHSDPRLRVHFFVARWDELRDEMIALGDEGQCWSWMKVRDFVTRRDAVISLRRRLGGYLATRDGIPDCGTLW